MAQNIVWRIVSSEEFSHHRYIRGTVQLVKLPTLSRFHCGSLLGGGVVRPAAANIRKWKCLENGEGSGGLSYCVGKKVSSVRRWEDVGSGILHPIDNLLKR